MRIDQYMLATCCSYLWSPQDVDVLLDNLKTNWQDIAVDSFRQTGKYSLSFTMDGTELPFDAWLRLMRAEKMRSVCLYQGLQPSKSGLPPHIAAAFMNGNRELLFVETEKRTHSFEFYTQSNSPYAMNGAEFYELLSAQKDAAGVKTYVLSAYNESREMNDQPIIDLANFAETLQEADPEILNYGLSFMFPIAQKYCLAVDLPFEVPDRLRSLMEEVKPLDLFADLNPDLVKPPESADLETKMAWARSMYLSVNHWLLASHKGPYQNFAFYRREEDIDRRPELLSEKVLSHFKRLLEKAIAFCSDSSSEFISAFQIARWILDTDELSLGDLTQASLETFLAKPSAGTTAFSNRDYLREVLNSVLRLQFLDLSEDRLRCLTASAAVERIFGGMGSWNDQNFGSTKEMRTYEKLSAQLYDALHDVFCYAIQYPGHPFAPGKKRDAPIKPHKKQI